MENTDVKKGAIEVVEAVPVAGTELNQNLDSVTDLAPLTVDSLALFDEETQAEIVSVAGQIDVREYERVMSYGQIPLLRSFEQAGKILEADQGSSADQEVMKQVTELAKQANESYDDFNIVLKEPNFLQKLLLKISASAKDKHDKELSVKALTSYRLLTQLRDSCEQWIDMLVDGFTKIHQSAMSDKLNCEELEKYIVAGRIAEQRIEAEVQAAKDQWELSGLIGDKENYETLKEGLETFHVVLLNLEKSRAAFGISIGQLYLQEKTNKNVQIAVRTQKANSMALTSQQLRNAVLAAKNKIALEGQKSIAGLNSELMKKISETTVLTAEESEKILLSGVYSIESALEAAKTVIAGCESIQKAREARNQNIAVELGKLETLLNDMKPFVSRLKEANSSETSSSSSAPQGTTSTKSSIKF